MDPGLTRDIISLTIGTIGGTGLVVLARNLRKAFRVLERLLRSEDLLYYTAKAQGIQSEGIAALMECTEKGRCNGELADAKQKLKDSQAEISDFLRRAAFGKRTDETKEVGQ